MKNKKATLPLKLDGYLTPEQTSKLRASLQVSEVI